jgi:Lon protease-like protein
MVAMPMFPLGTVLLPGGVLPLHVFEDRYKQLVRDCLAVDGPAEFGVVLIERGHEVGGGDHRADVGTVARMTQVAALDHGGYAMVTVGVRRVRVLRWLPDDPYPIADVDEWPDDPQVSEADALRSAVTAAEARLREVLELARSLGQLAEVPDDLGISPDPLLATYHLGAIAPLGPADQFRLLAASNPTERLELLCEALDDVEAMLRFRST